MRTNPAKVRWMTDHAAAPAHGRLLETDLVPWNRDALQRRVRETETLIRRLRRVRLEREHRWILRELIRDLRGKRRLLERL